MSATICFAMLWIAATPIRAAEPVTITFEDIFNKPFGHDSLPPFTWRGVLFSGGGLHRTPELGTWYQARNRNAIELKFPPGSTDISFEADGLGITIFLPDKMPIQVWMGDIDTGTLVATLPLPASIVDIAPPEHKVTIPGPASLITLFSAPAPSGIRDVSNIINIDNIRYTPPDPEPTITFDTVLPAHAKVLTHNYGAYPYPSPLQTQDGAIRVQATVLVNSQPAAGKTIHLRLIDPPDTAPYVRQAGDDKFEDNFDGPGSLNASGQATTTAVSDGAGRIFVTLHATSFAAGDNYQIEASGNADFPCSLSCAKSAVYTAWKRVYVEYNKMFRKGAYITDDVVAGSKKIEVSNVNAFPDPPFVVRLIHAPRFGGVGGAVFYSETVTITEVPGRSWLGIGTNPGVLKLDPDPAVAGIQHSYFRGEAVGQNPALRPYLADGVGLATGDRKADFFLLDGRLVRQTFDEAFIEHVWLTDAVPTGDVDIPPDDPRLAFDGAIPFDSRIDDPDDQELAWLPRKWIQHAQRIGQDRISEPNHFALFTATRREGSNGRTTVASRFNDLWLFVQQIGNATQIAESLVHELGHEWRVNADWQPGVAHGPGAMTGGHCSTAFGKDVNTYGRNLKCAMHQLMYGDDSDPERRDGIAGFHYVHTDGTADSEYLRIRRRDEPVPQNEHQRGTPK